MFPATHLPPRSGKARARDHTKSAKPPAFYTALRTSWNFRLSHLQSLDRHPLREICIKIFRISCFEKWVKERLWSGGRLACRGAVESRPAEEAQEQAIETGIFASHPTWTFFPGGGAFVPKPFHIEMRWNDRKRLLPPSPFLHRMVYPLAKAKKVFDHVGQPSNVVRLVFRFKGSAARPTRHPLLSTPGDGFN